MTPSRRLVDLTPPLSDDPLVLEAERFQTYLFPFFEAVDDFNASNKIYKSHVNCHVEHPGYESAVFHGNRREKLHERLAHDLSVCKDILKKLASEESYSKFLSIYDIQKPSLEK